MSDKPSSEFNWSFLVLPVLCTRSCDTHMNQILLPCDHFAASSALFIYIHKQSHYAAGIVEE